MCKICEDNELESAKASKTGRNHAPAQVGNKQLQAPSLMHGDNRKYKTKQFVVAWQSEYAFTKNFIAPCEDNDYSVSTETVAGI
jgi:hypothetical protein